MSKIKSSLLSVYASHRGSEEKLSKYQLNSSCVIISLILVTTLFYKPVILQGEICCRSLLDFKGLSLCALVRGTGLRRTFLCTISVRRSKYCLKFSIALRFFLARIFFTSLPRKPRRRCESRRLFASIEAIRS